MFFILFTNIKIVLFDEKYIEKLIPITLHDL